MQRARDQEALEYNPLHADRKHPARIDQTQLRKSPLASRLTVGLLLPQNRSYPAFEYLKTSDLDLFVRLPAQLPYHYESQQLHQYH